MTNESTLKERLLAVLKLLAYEQRPCRHCGQILYFVLLPEGAAIQGAFRVKESWAVAFNGEGENHAGHCSGAGQRVPEQQTLLSVTTRAEQNGFDPA